MTCMKDTLLVSGGAGWSCDTPSTMDKFAGGGASTEVSAVTGAASVGAGPVRYNAQSQTAVPARFSLLPTELCAMRGLSWCVLYVRPGAEVAMVERVTRVARDAVAAAIVLRREVDYAQHGVWGKRVSTLFPGYVIVPASNVDGLEQALSLITEYHHLVRVGGAPAELSAEDVATFAGLADADWIIRASVGDIVDGVLKVKQGPLAGRENLLGRIDRHRRLAYFKPGAFPLFTGEQARRRADRVSGAGRRVGQRPPCVGLQVVSKT